MCLWHYYVLILNVLWPEQLIHFWNFWFQDLDDGENLSIEKCGKWNGKASAPWRAAIGKKGDYCFGVIVTENDVLTRKHIRLDLIVIIISLLCAYIALCRNVLKRFYRDGDLKALFGRCHDRILRGNGNSYNCYRNEKKKVVIWYLFIAIDTFFNSISIVNQHMYIY